jgi:DNA-binding XRE family transcriptional regulator
VAEKYEDKSKAVDRILPKDVFANIEKEYTKAGVLLRGTRHREGLTQAEMAKKISVTQADLSKMESGKRPIGKIIAKRIAKIFKVDYRYFL